MPGFNLNDYITVDERIDQFWAEHKVDGAITTELIWVADNGQSVAIRATVEIAGRVVATGIAQEDRGPNGANKTSWWENAETSAIGRALANYGMSLSKARPSREEMQKVQRGEQTSPSQPAPRQEPRPLRPSALAAEVSDDYGWTDFWSWAKARGIKDRQALDEAAGQPTSGKTPAEIRRLIEAHAASA
jgi:hypothetical protein